jgi:DNA-binding transcriptional ArsR family regulator
MIEAEPDKGLSTPSSFNYAKGTKMKVELDKKALFALASDSRMEILKALHPQRRTVAQLADELGIDKAAIHRHLKKLEEGGLVTRYEDHGFVYYGLSWKARDVISPGENARIVIVFSLSWLLIAGAVGAFVLSLSSMDFMAGGMSNPAGEQVDSAGRYDALSSLSPEMVLLGIVLACVAAVLLYLGSRRVWRPKQKALQADGSVPTRHDEMID